MTTFVVEGPFKISRFNHRVVTSEEAKEFWQKHKKYAKHRGCYVFGIRASRGFKPGYVGKTRRKLKHEVFTDRNINLYNRFLAAREKGTPVLFFVLMPVTRGKPNGKLIREVEKYLVNLGFTANPDLLNKQDRALNEWGIRGVVRGGKGKTTSGTKEFRKMMAIE
jgi:hypothetical protein